MPALSIIIPTHQRSKILKHCMDRIDAQTVAEQLEVIVVSDGHDASAAALFENSPWQVSISYLEIEKSQQGVARNRGVALARAPLCLFIGDDIYLEPDACERHLEAHNCQFAALGFTTWDPAVDITPVMHWLERSGWQFGYPMIEKYTHEFIPPRIQHLFTYTSHISLPLEMAKRFPFREDVSLYGWEDIEWGKRLASASIPLYYECEARALHHHRVTLDESLLRMETLGRSVQYFPDIGRNPVGWKRLAYEIAALFPTMAGRHRKAFLKGLKNPSKWV